MSQRQEALDYPLSESGHTLLPTDCTAIICVQYGPSLSRIMERVRNHPIIERLVAVLVVLIATVMVAPTASATTDIPDAGSVVHIQQALQRTGFYRGPVDGVENQAMRDAIMAFHKVMSVERTSVWTADDWYNLWALDHTGFDVPDRPGEPDRIEIDLYRQVMYLVEDGDVSAVFPIVSGRGDTYERLGRKTGGAHTPVGDYTIIRHVAGWRHGSYGAIYRPWYFVGGYAIHGSKIARPQPASHGCVRTPMDDMDWLEQRLELGMPVHVWVGESSTAVAMMRLERLSASLEAAII